MSDQADNQENLRTCLRILAFIDDCIKNQGSSPTFREIYEALNISGPGVVHFHINNMEEDGWITSAKNKNGNRKVGKIQLTEIGKQELARIATTIPPNNGDNQPEPVEQPEVSGSPANTNGSALSSGHREVLDVGYVVLSARISNHRVVRTVNIPILNLISASFGNEVHSSDFSISGLGPDQYLSINQDMLPVRLRNEDLFALEVSGESMIDAGIQHGDYVIVRRAQTADNGDMCVVWIDETEATLKYFYREEKRVRLEPANRRMAPMTYGPSHTVTIQGKVVLVVRR